MSDFEDKHMDFILKHYQEGKFDTQKAIQRFNEAHGIVRKPRGRVLPWVSGVVAAAAAAATPDTQGKTLLRGFCMMP